MNKYVIEIIPFPCMMGKMETVIVETNKDLDTTMELMKKQLEENEKINEANKLKNLIEKQTLKFYVKTGAADKVFGTISSKQIAAELKNKNIIIDKKLIDKDININCLGTHIVKINLHKSVVAELKVELKKES